MRKKEQKANVPLSINEVIFIGKVAKICGFEIQSMPSYKGATFNAVKLVKGDMNKYLVKVICHSFKKEFNKKLFYEYQTFGTETIVYLTIKQQDQCDI